MNGQRRVFTSNISFHDAGMKAKFNGCVPIGQAINGNLYVVFARQVRV